MKVRDLIAQLQSLDPECDVFRGDDTYGMLPVTHIETPQARDLPEQTIVLLETGGPEQEEADAFYAGKDFEREQQRAAREDH